MPDDIIIYEAGIRYDNGKYSQYIQSKNEEDIDEYILIMKETKIGNSEIVKMIKTFRCISTIPYIIE